MFKTLHGPRVKAKYLQASNGAQEVPIESMSLENESTKLPESSSGELGEVWPLSLIT